MPTIAIPNVSEGADQKVIGRLAASITDQGAALLDIHSDPIHNRSVFTVTAPYEALVAAMVGLAAVSARLIDLTHQAGVHPRLGALDVCPFVPLHDASVDDAIEAAETCGALIAESLSIPVLLYGLAARNDASRELPSIRRGGLTALAERMKSGLSPDFGPAEVDPRTGVVCVGARKTLIAFNVWLRGDPSAARSIARRIRTSSGGPPGVRALGLDMGNGLAQVSMNLTDPQATGIDEIFDLVVDLANQIGASAERTEIVGLVPERFLPDPARETARLMVQPGRSLESVLP